MSYGRVPHGGVPYGRGPYGTAAAGGTAELDGASTVPAFTSTGEIDVLVQLSKSGGTYSVALSTGELDVLVQLSQAGGAITSFTSTGSLLDPNAGVAAAPQYAGMIVNAGRLMNR